LHQSSSLQASGRVDGKIAAAQNFEPVLAMVHSRLLVAIIFIGMVLLSRGVRAHHSYAAEFDRDSPMTIEGVVTEVWFKSPHVRYYVKVIDEDGNEVVWDTRGLTPVKLVREGWMKDTIKVGDKIKIFGHVGHSNKTIMSILDVTLPDGRVLTSRSVAYDIKN
jgi:hypothetical protein